jgi:hypothetical protein
MLLSLFWSIECWHILRIRPDCSFAPSFAVGCRLNKDKSNTPFMAFNCLMFAQLRL